MVTEPKVLYEFGPFRVDPDKQVLLCKDRPVAITPKAFETLLILIRHSREVVSKDELMKTVWPDAFVEEANVSQNISVLRKALGETPEDRRYIVTLPGRGYRFAAQVRTLLQDGEDLVLESRSRSQMVIEQTDRARSQRVDAHPTYPDRGKIRRYLVPIAAVLGLSLLGAAYFLRRPQPIVLGEKDSVLVADFTNTTGDPVFDDALRQGLEVQLEQSPFMSLISEDRTQQALRSMGQPLDARLTPEIAREVCQRTASAAVVDGSITSLGTRYVVGLRAKACTTGNVLAEEQAQAARKEDVLNALGQVASRIRSRVGESLATVEKYNTPLADATTPSLEALKAYSTGRKVLSSTGPAASLPHFQRAIEIDPKFAIAYANLGNAYASIGESDLSVENISKAYQLRDRASDIEKFHITASYDLEVTGNLEKAQQTCEAWAQTYPREMTPHGFLSGAIYPVFGRYEKAVEEGKKVVELDPDFAIGYNILALGYEELDRLGESENTLQRASERKLEIPDFLVDRYEIAFIKGDREGMEREMARAQGKSGAEDVISDQESFALAYSGHLAQARRSSQRAIAELGAPPSSFFGFFGTLYPVYVRGEAYLAANQGGKAAAEFQKILNHRGIVISDPIGAVTRLQLARAFVLSADKMKAKATYQDFLTLWKDADNDIPILKQAKAEYAKLQ